MKISNRKANYPLEKGSALVMALLILALLMAFVALSMSRVSSESAVAYNDSLETKTFNAAQAGLEDATRDFATVVESKLSPADKDISDIKASVVPNFNEYKFTKDVQLTRNSEPITIQAGEFQGLYSLRDEWEIKVKAEEVTSGVNVELRRRFFNNRIPLFQFGAFYNDDLELNRPPLFVFGGRVHTNGNLFVSAYPLDKNAGIFFKSKLTVTGEVVNDVWKTGASLVSYYDDNGDVYIPNSTNIDQKLPTGSSSVKCTTNTGGGILKDPTDRNFPYPICQTNTNWETFSQIFEGNLQAHAQPLKLPIEEKLNQNTIEMIRRGKNIGDKANINGAVTSVTAATQDSIITSKERFANKPGIRISLANLPDRLPGGGGGVQLDGRYSNNGYTSLGYKPLTMLGGDGYTTTALNGNRLAGQVWIKIETVDFDYNNGVPITQDITEDILSLGVTEPAPVDTLFKILGYDSDTDTRSIIKMQRFAIRGPAMETNYISNMSLLNSNYNVVRPYLNVPSAGLSVCPTNCTVGDLFAPPYKNGGTTVPAMENPNIPAQNERAHYKLAAFDGSFTDNNQEVIVPFPIKIFDTREGARRDTNNLSSGNVYQNGVMSLVDIDVYNLRRFLRGDFDGKFPNNTAFAAKKGSSLRSSDIPELRGWVVYFSDRRGDANFDGRYDMEDVNPNGNALIEEDLNNNGTIDTDYANEAPSQDSYIESSYAAVTDHTFYRRAVRLINGTALPGKYDTLAPQNSKGFTFASENGVYVLGNYNVNNGGVSLPGGSQVADSSRYTPLDSADHIAAAIVGDAVSILSNNWKLNGDGNSFVNPLDEKKRAAADTQIRFAMISGDSNTTRDTSGGFAGLNGGIHNFKRFLENWNGKRLNYSGSLVNLYNSFNNNGRFKCCTTVYEPPIRDWTFESSFTDANRLPPGTPFVYNLSFTGFERMND